MKSTLLLTALAVFSSAVVAVPTPMSMYPPGSLKQRWRWTDWADADSTEEAVAAKRNTDNTAIEKRWAWTKWEDAADETAEKKVKRWAWTKWEDADDAPEEKAKRWAWTKWEDAADEAPEETQ